MQYVGWGGLPQAFDHRNAEWEAEFKELAELLSGPEYEAARRSTQDAHYTSQTIIQGIYAGVDRLGFQGGESLEPSVGIGHFIGLMPSAMRERSTVTGVELDDVTARIAKALYPSAAIINRGYQDVKIPDGYFDLVIGNPPFGNQRLYDPEHEDLAKFTIHNYFVAKSLEKLRPGGLLAMVVSRHFMDATDSQVREHVADKAHFLGAIRLPNTAFKANALAEVTTDIVFFQRAAEGETPSREWTETASLTLADEGEDEAIQINRWFIDHPKMMLGDMARTGGIFGDAVDLVPRDGEDLASELAYAVEQLPSGRYTDRLEPGEGKAKKEAIDIPEGTQIGAFFVHADGRVGRRLPDILDKQDYEWAVGRNDTALARVRGMVEVRNTLRTLLNAEQEDWPDASLDAMREELNRSYDRFQRRHGYLNSQANRLAMVEDPEYPLLQALEQDYDRGLGADAAKRHGAPARAPTAKKAAIFSQRVIRPRRPVEKVETGREALAVSMNERGGVDIDFMVRIVGKAEDALIEELEGLMFHNPESQRWETNDKYLSGNVKEKLEIARAAAGQDGRYRINVSALQAIQPPDIEAVDIAVQLGSTWVPASDVQAFVRHLLGEVKCQVNYQPAIGRWVSKIGAGSRTVCEAQWGTEDFPAHNLVEAILERREIKVRERTGTNPQNGAPIYTVNETATAAANQKADEIRQAFQDWIWQDQERRDRLAKLYNEKFNVNVAPHYDGAHLELPGSSPLIQMRQHQKDGVWRGIQEGGTLFDHVVGAGKTYEMVATAIESRRMGLMNKPMFVVPNHLLLQWRDAFYALYPGCNVLVAEKSDFEKDNRQRLFSRIATGNWDAVVVAHSSFKKIGMPPDMLEAILTEQIDDLTDAIIQLKEEKGDRLSIKEMEKAKERMEGRLERVADTGSKDGAVTFADLGVDALFVDELHEFKNLYIVTSMSRISGLGNLAGSEKAFDLFVKARYIQQKNDGKGFYGGTGTPISNTIAEMYTMQRYFQYDDLKRWGLVHFDSWASTFGQVVQGWELDATGVNYKVNSRFSKFQNVPELVSMYRSFADVITKQDLERQAKERGERPLTPPIKGGRAKNVIVDRSSFQETYMGYQSPVLGDDGQPVLRADGTQLREWNEGSIIWRMENLPKDPRRDNPLKITNDARKAGLDFRLIDPDAPDFEGSKVNEMVREAYAIWKRWDARKGTQLLFCDLSTPKGGKGRVGQGRSPEHEAEDAEEPTFSMDELLSSGAKFSVYDDIKAKLIALGVPEEQIRFIHDAKTDAQKAKLFADVNRGDVRLLLGTTAKMGPGMNVQRRLVAEHHLDAPWRPSDLEQREGRIVRQGNLFYEEDPDGFEVEILRYATRQTYDSRMWQTIEYKARGIEEFRRGDSLQRVIEDVASEAANAADMKAAASGNPLILMQVQIAGELKKVEAALSNWNRTRFSLENRAVWLERADVRADADVASLQAEIARRDANTKKEWQFASGGKTFRQEQKQEMIGIVMDAMKRSLDLAKGRLVGDAVQQIPVGEYRGFKISVSAMGSVIQFSLKGEASHEPDTLKYRSDDTFDMGGFFTRIDNALSKFESGVQAAERRRDVEKAEFATARAELGKPFQQAERLKVLREDAGAVLAELRLIQREPDYVSTWLPKSMEPPEDLAAAVNAALEAGHKKSTSDLDVAVSEVLAAMQEVVMDRTNGRNRLEELRACQWPEEERPALLEKLEIGLKGNLALANQFALAPLRCMMPDILDEAVNLATGFAEEERKLAWPPAHMMIGRAHYQGPHAEVGGELQGKVLAVSERCVILEAGRGFATLHRKADLSGRCVQSLAEGQTLRIRYEPYGLGTAALVGTKAHDILL